MGYTTEFTGSIGIDPPLNDQEIEFLQKFSESRRMARTRGPYYVEGEGNDLESKDITDYNGPPEGQPGLWCQWIPTPSGAAIEWDGGEKFYSSGEWMIYLINHFLKPGALAAKELPFLQANHLCNGVIKAQGEDMDDRWKMTVVNNQVTFEDLE